MTTLEMEQISPVKEFLLTYLMPEKCYDNFFIYFNFLHVPCLKIVLSKTMGLWLLLGTVIAPFPQIWKVAKARCSEGLCFGSVLLQLFAISSSVVYCIHHKFPISAWAESLFQLIQTMALGFLIQHHSGNTIKGVWFLMSYCGTMCLLTSSLTPGWVIAMMYASRMLAVIASRLLQAGTNFYNGHTGQLSALSVCLVFFGSLALVFTSLQETLNSMLTQVVAACFSFLLLVQVLYYRNSRTTNKEKDD